jgi:mRNA interferase RelE/StbE
VRNLSITKEALEFIRALESKPFKQVLNKVLSLLSDPTPADSIQMKGHGGLHRTDMGEHRIVYCFDEDTVSVLVIGKRNDDAVYKQVERKKL